MKRFLLFCTVIPLFLGQCYSYTSAEFEGVAPNEASSPGRLVLPDQVLDQYGRHHSAFEPTKTTIAMSNDIFTGENSALQIELHASVSQAESNGIEVLGILTLCALPCGTHKNISINVSYLLNGVPVKTETYRARYQVWGGLIIGAVGVDRMAEHPDVNSAIQSVLPVVAARSRSILQSDEAGQVAGPLAWLKEKIPADEILDISRGLLQLDAAHFSCLEHSKVYRCDPFDGDEFRASVEGAENAKIRDKKYVLLSDWHIGSEKLAKYDFQNQRFPVAQTRVETTDSFWNIKFVHQDTKDMIEPESRYAFLYDEQSGRPFYSMQTEEAEKFRHKKRSLRLFAIAKIQPPTTVERTLYVCMLNNGRTFDSFADGPLCRKKGTVRTKHVYLKIIRWVLMEVGGQGVQRGE